ncbi:hypothetical protein NC651_023885 [Populus alba x Populus x berolinensis]|nr:hypothetical protein NC651_023885 [Populus alba x Populus x berolinensis]
MEEAAAFLAGLGPAHGMSSGNLLQEGGCLSFSMAFSPEKGPPVRLQMQAREKRSDIGGEEASVVPVVHQFMWRKWGTLQAI